MPLLLESVVRTSSASPAQADLDGGYLDFVGGMEGGGTFELRHERRDADGSVVPFRMRFSEISRDAFTWQWERGEVDGTWTEQWRIDNTRRS